MNAKRVVMIVATVALAAGATVALAGPGGRGGAGMRGDGMRGPLGPLGRALQRLDLSAEQQAQVESLVAEAKPAIEALREQLRVSREEFQATHPPTSFDEAAIRAHAAAQTGIHTELAVATARLRARVLGVLTPEQLAELDAMRAAMRERGGPPHDGPHGGPHDGPWL